MGRVDGAHVRVIVPEGNTAHFEEIMQRRRATGKPVFDLTTLKFEPHTYHFRD